MIITEAGVDDRVTQLLYVTSVMPDSEQPQADLIGSEPAPWLSPSDDGTIGVDPDMIRELFLQDRDEVTTEQALSRLTRQSLAPFSQQPRQIAWHQKPATYFVYTADLATPAEVQRRRVRAGARVVEFDAGHHSFLSRPAAFAQTLAAEIDSAGSPSPDRSTSTPYSPTVESRSDCPVLGKAVAAAVTLSAVEQQHATIRAHDASPASVAPGVS